MPGRTSTLRERVEMALLGKAEVELGLGRARNTVESVDRVLGGIGP